MRLKGTARYADQILAPAGAFCLFVCSFGKTRRLFLQIFDIKKKFIYLVIISNPGNFGNLFESRKGQT